jgi:adenylate cyclase, class 2
MAENARHREIEIKLRVRDIAAIRKRLAQLRARKILPRTFESNTLYDTSGNDLRRRGHLLRIRIEEPAGKFAHQPANESASAILTYKAPSRSRRKPGVAAPKPSIRRQFKVRDEAEVSLKGAGQMAGILRGLGFNPVFRYEKIRTTYALPKEPGLKVEWDETPIGIYVELEGPVAAIHRAARLLGYARTDYLKDTYGSLYLAECRRRGRKPGDMIFQQKK